MKDKKKLEVIVDEEPGKLEEGRKSRQTNSSLNNDESATFAIFSEPAVATKAYDPRIVEGLVSASLAQGFGKKVGHVCFAGSALPYIPTFYGKQNQRELIFLGYDPDKKIDERYAELLDDPSVPKEVKDTIKKWGANKILTLEEAAECGRKSFGRFIEQAFPKANIHYIYGEEDNRNFDDHIELEFDKVFVLREAEEKCLIEQNKNRAGRERLEKQQKDLETQRNIFQLLRKAITSNNGKLREKIERVISSQAEGVANLEYPEKFKKTINSIKQSKDIDYKLEILDRQAQNLQQEESRVGKQKDEIEYQLGKIGMQKRAPSFFMTVKRKNLDAAQAEEMRARVKPWYQALLCHLFPNNPFYPHGGNSIELILDGVTVALHHQASVKSIVPGKSDIKKLVNEYSQQAAVPDLVITGHGSSGLRIVPQQKNVESISPKKERDTPEITTIVQAATLQSGDSLKTLITKSIKNNHTKRYEETGFASGVLFYTLYKKTKEVELTFISSNQLLEDYRTGLRIQRLASRLKDTTGKTAKEKLKSRMQKQKEKLRFSPVNGLALADSHFGCANTPGRPTNYEVFEAVKAYMKKEGMPEILILDGDMVHGALESFGSSQQYFADIPSDFEAKIEGIFSNKKLGLEDIAKQVKQASHRTVAAIPITSSSKQLAEFKNRFNGMIESILDSGGQVYIVSGNHYNGTASDRDEAQDIVNMLDLKYRNHPNLNVFSAEGEKSGVGEGLLQNGKRVYCCHEPKRGPDQILGALNQLKSSNQSPHLAVFAHNHHPAAGYGNGTFILNCAGMQPWNTYVSRIGLTPGLRGCVYFELDRNGREQLKWKFVLDPTLEHYTAEKGRA